ncbi:YhbY family RNA-binding protein [Patescibacteria group bacterium]|nr:YhbY family RNA-binding protein [Patescibacteria group bacterium]
MLSKIQIGKNGITGNFMETLKSHFLKHRDVKVQVLKSARIDKESVKKYEAELLERLGKNYTARTIGFVIKVKKWRSAKA